MICKQCNQENWEGAAFCAYCGASLAADETAPQASETPETTEAPQTYDTPASPNVQDTTSVADSNTTSTPAPKKKKGLLLIPVILLLLLAVGFLAYKFFVSSTPEHEVSTGVNKTFQSLSDSIGSAEGFSAITQTLTDKNVRDSFGADIYFSDGDNKIDLSFAADQTNSIFRADIGADVEGYEFDVIVAADKSELMLQMEQLGDTIYTIPLGSFGKKYEGSALSDMLLDSGEEAEQVDRFLSSLAINLFAKADFQEFRKNCPQLDEFIKSLEFNEVEEGLFGNTDLTVYHVSVSARTLAELYAKYSEFAITQLIGEEAMQELKSLSESYGMDMSSVLMGVGDRLAEELEEYALDLYFGLNDDDYLTAFYGCTAEDPENGIGIHLAGEKNIWHEVLIYEGTDIVAGISMEETKNGFTLSFFDAYYGDRETVFSIVCNDSIGRLSFCDEDNEEVFAILYTVTDTKFTLSPVIPDESIIISLTLEKNRPVSLPKGEKTSLLDFEQSDFLSLAMSIAMLFY